jgi:hypothetical protein
MSLFVMHFQYLLKPISNLAGDHITEKEKHQKDSCQAGSLFADSYPS